jgi:two-component system NtrC family sensor kinase
MNALTHAFREGKGGTIEIRVTMESDAVELHFCDDGVGVAPDHIGKVFDPFFTTRRGSGGTGLGLNIVFNILVKQFGGAITVHSGLGQGTCFRLRFPRVSPMAVQQ